MRKLFTSLSLLCALSGLIFSQTLLGGSGVKLGGQGVVRRAGAIRIGNGVGDSTHFYDGRIGEMAIYNAALTGSNLTNAATYFTNKW